MRLTFILFFTTINYISFSQDIFRLNADTISGDDLLFKSVDDTLSINNKKKTKKNIFFGIKTKKGFIRVPQGRNNIYENFHFILSSEIKNPYAQEIHFFDKKSRKIIRSKSISDNTLLLHGPYIKRLNNQVIEEGYFYYGLKQGRWIRLNRSDILQDKENYTLGWQNESLRYYWDYDKLNLKEIIPIKYGEMHGKYYAFFRDGKVAARGEYINNSKVGTWTEFFNSGKKKREIKYDDLPFSTNPSFIIREWNNNGKLIYDRNLFTKN